ncbi:MAG: phosphate ABC transporter permease subunit PstC [Acidimicrobiales bacterium]
MAATSIPTFVDAATRPRQVTSRRDRGDRIFDLGTSAAGFAVLAIMTAVGLFLSLQAAQALGKTGISFLTTAAWQPDRGQFGIAAVLLGTALIALVAVAVALPISMGTALFITDVAPPRIRSAFVAMVDLMAAVPSVVYGLWGLFLLQGRVVGLSRWLATWLSWLPIFKVTDANVHGALPNTSSFTASTFIAGLVVAMMVMPIQCSVMREVFSQVPAGEREGAYALGATRWGMIRIVSLPFGRGGIIGGTMLGLGRALGETIAVLLIISPRFTMNFHVLEVGSNSVSSLIALRYGEASGFGLSALMAAGLALFMLTLAVNFTAAIFVARSRSGASTDA